MTVNGENLDSTNKMKSRCAPMLAKNDDIDGDDSADCGIDIELKGFEFHNPFFGLIIDHNGAKVRIPRSRTNRRKFRVLQMDRVGIGTGVGPFFQRFCGRTINGAIAVLPIRVRRGGNRVRGRVGHGVLGRISG